MAPGRPHCSRTTTTLCLITTAKPRPCMRSFRGVLKFQVMKPFRFMFTLCVILPSQKVLAEWNGMLADFTAIYSGSDPTTSLHFKCFEVVIYRTDRRSNQKCVAHKMAKGLVILHHCCRLTGLISLLQVTDPVWATGNQDGCTSGWSTNRWEQHAAVKRLNNRSHSWPLTHFFPKVSDRAEHLGSGLLHRGLKPSSDTFIGIFAQNRPEVSGGKSKCLGFLFNLNLLYLYCAHSVDYWRAGLLHLLHGSSSPVWHPGSWGSGLHYQPR